MGVSKGCDDPDFLYDDILSDLELERRLFLQSTCNVGIRDGRNPRLGLPLRRDEPEKIASQGKIQARLGGIPGETKAMKDAEGS